MTFEQLVATIKQKKSMLCVGLDPELSKIPPHLLQTEDPIFEFNKKIIDATLPYAVAYKPNMAFYEAQGAKGWLSLEKTINYLPNTVFKIADAKRGDIGNTSKAYAEAFFSSMNFDAVTLSPYMGMESILSFLQFPNKWVILLGATSNEGYYDFQNLEIKNSNLKLYEFVAQKSLEVSNNQNLMLVVGATRIEELEKLRKLLPNHFFLIPGIGVQGGDLKTVCKMGMNTNAGLLINASRSIIYANKEEDFEKYVAKEAQNLQSQMASYF